MIAIISDSNDILTDPHYLLRVQQGMSVNTNRFLSGEESNMFEALLTVVRGQAICVALN